MGGGSGDTSGFTWPIHCHCRVQKHPVSLHSSQSLGRRNVQYYMMNHGSLASYTLPPLGYCVVNSPKSATRLLRAPTSLFPGNEHTAMWKVCTGTLWRNKTIKVIESPEQTLQAVRGSAQGNYTEGSKQDTGNLHQTMCACVCVVHCDHQCVRGSVRYVNSYIPVDIQWCLLCESVLFFIRVPLVLRRGRRLQKIHLQR